MLVGKTARKYIIITIILISFILSIFILSLSGSQSKTPLAERSWTIKALQAKINNYRPEILMYGKVDSPQKSTLASTLKTTVKKVLVKEGDFVEKQALLIALDDKEYSLIVKQKQAQLERLQASIAAETEQHASDLETLKHLESLVQTNQRIMERYEILAKKQHASQAQIDEKLTLLLQQQINLRAKELNIKNHPQRIQQLKADLATIEAQLMQAKNDVMEARIVAPFNGKITEVFVATGDNVADNQKLLNIYNIQHVELRAQLPSKYIPVLQKIDKKEMVHAIPQNYPQYTLPLLRTGAELKEGEPSIDAFFDVPLELAQSLPLGYTLAVRLILPEEKQVIRIPSSALYSGDHIYVIKNKRLESKEVEVVGEQYDDKNNHFYLIKDMNLNEKTLILKTRLPNVQEGLKVNLL